MRPPRTIHVELESTNDPDSEQAVLEVFKLLLKDLDDNPVDNAVDEQGGIRYSMKKDH